MTSTKCISCLSYYYVEQRQNCTRNNLPACSVLWDYSKYSSVLSFCEVPLAPFAEPPSTYTPTMPRDAGIKNDEQPASFSKALSASQQKGKRGRAGCQWGLVPSLRWPQFRASRSKPSVHSLQCIYRSWPQELPKVLYSLKKHPWESAQLVFVRSTTWAIGL